MFQDKPKVLSTEDLLTRFNAQKAGQPQPLSKDVDPWGMELVDIDSMIGGAQKTPKVPVAETAPEAEGDRQGFFPYIGKKLKSSAMSLGEMVTEIPQAVEAFANTPAVMLTESAIRRGVRRGEIEPESGDILLREAKTLTPTRGLGRTIPTVGEEGTIGQDLADSDLNEWFDKNKRKFADQATRYDRTVTEYIKSGQYGKALGAIAGGIAESLAPTIAAAFIPGGAAALGAGVAAQQYDEVKDREDMGESMKMADAVTQGVFEWLFERFGSREMGKALTQIYKKSGKKGVIDAIASPGVQNLIAKGYKKFGVWFAPVHEGVSEVLTTLGQNAAAILSGEDPERKWNEGAWDSFLIGAGMGGMFAGVEQAAEKARNVTDSRTLQRDQLAVDTYGEDKINELAGLMRVGDKEGMSAFMYGLETPAGEGNGKKRESLWKLAQKRASQPSPQSPGQVRQQEDIDAEDQIRTRGRELVLGGFNDQDPISNTVRFADTRDGRKVMILAENNTESGRIFSIKDASSPDAATEMLAEKDVLNTLDVPYEEWVQNELRQYHETRAQIDTDMAKANAPVEEGQDITIGEQRWIVSQVTPDGITLNEIDEEGNISGNVQQVTPDQYEKVFGTPAAGTTQPQPQAPAETIQPAAQQAEQLQAAPAVSQQSRKISDGKNEFTIAPMQDGNFQMSETFQTQKDAEGTIKKLQSLYPKLKWEYEMEDSGDYFTPDIYRIVAKVPVKKEEAKAQAPAESPKVEQKAPEVAPVEAPKEETEQPIVEQTKETPSTPDETAPVEAEMQEAGEMDAPEVQEKAEPEEQPGKRQPLSAFKPGDMVRNVTGDVWEVVEIPADIEQRAILRDPNDGSTVEWSQKIVSWILQKKEESPEVQLIKANAEVEPKPTEAQKEAGNFPKGHFRWQGMDISIENAPMSVRSGTDKSGKEWKQIMHNPYGYIRRTLGPETEGKDQVDIFLGDNLDSETVFVVDQVDPETGLFDEPKVMGAFSSIDEARDAYLANYEPGWKGLGAITAMPLDEFKQWVYDREKTSKPLDANVPVKGGEKADNGVAQWVDAFNKAKENNDLNAIQDIYDKVSIYINGPAQKYGEQVVNELTQLRGQIEAYAEEARKSNQKAKPEFAGESLDNAPRTRSLREFNKGDHVKNIKTGNKYEVVSVPKTGDISLKELGGKKIQNFNGKLAQWIPIQREIKAKGAKRTVKFGPDSQKGKLLSKAPQTFKELILQFFIGGGRVSHADFLRYVGWKAGKKEGFIWAVKGSADGKTEQGKAFDSFWEDAPEEWGRKGGTEDTNEIADILKSYPSITAMMNELERLQNKDDEAESVPDRNIPSQEELDKAMSDADMEDDLSNHEDEVVGRLDDVWDNPDYQIIFDEYSDDKGLNVDKLLADINDNPEKISNFTPFGLNDKELNTLKNYLEDEQSRRKESQVPESIQGPDKDKGPDREEDSSGSDQGDRVRGAAEESGTSEEPEVDTPGREYKYKMNARPFDIGTYPLEGFVKAEDDPKGGFQILTYNRKLTDKERNHWSFLPLTEVDELEGKQFEDQDGEYFVDLEWMPNYSGADVSMFDNKNQLVEKPYFMSTNDILKNIESGYWVEKKEQNKKGKTITPISKENIIDKLIQVIYNESIKKYEKTGDFYTGVNVYYDEYDNIIHIGNYQDAKVDLTDLNSGIIGIGIKDIPEFSDFYVIPELTDIKDEIVGQISSVLLKHKQQSQTKKQGTPQDDIDRLNDLSGEAPILTDKEIEDKFRQDLTDNYEKYKAEYLAKFGYEIGGDNAKELSSVYRSNRTKYSQAVHEPASEFAKKLFEDIVSGPLPEGLDNAVVFTAGGTGAGKTTAMKLFLPDNNAIIYDSNMSNIETARHRIDFAIKHGKSVEIDYVWRDPYEAFFDGVIPRMRREGRSVSVENHVKTHTKALATFRNIYDLYKDNENVKFRIYNTEYDQTLTPEQLLSRSIDSKELTERIENEVRRQRKLRWLTAEEERSILRQSQVQGQAQREERPASQGDGGASPQDVPGAEPIRGRIAIPGSDTEGTLTKPVTNYFGKENIDYSKTPISLQKVVLKDGRTFYLVNSVEWENGGVLAVYEEEKPKQGVKQPEKPKAPDYKTPKGQAELLKYLIDAEDNFANNKTEIAKLKGAEGLSPVKRKELKQRELIQEQNQKRLDDLLSLVDDDILSKEKQAEIRKLIKQTNALNAAIAIRILRLQDNRDAKEKSLQKRNEVFGDRKAEEDKKKGEQDMFAGEYLFTPSSDLLKAALKPFNDGIKKAEEDINRNNQLLDEQIDLVLNQSQGKIDWMDTPAEPVDSKPIDKESVPKLEDFGQKIGGARKDMETTRTARDTDNFPAWRRKYHYANADGTLNLGAPIDTSKPFIVQWSKDVDTWNGKRTVYRPVTTIDTRETKIFNSEEEAEAYIPIYEVWNQKFRIRKNGDNYVITKTSSTNKVVEYATFPTEEEANTYMYSTEGATSLLNHKREDFSIPALDKVERTGKDWRNGKDISTEEFMETFGFRGGEFGNWVKPEERRVMLNAAYDSFMDLAELLGVPPRSLSLSGELSIAFGARGVKGAAAHFEPDRAVINLTRMNGAGSLAHEWAHALDNYFGLQAAKKDYSRNDKGEVIAGKVMRTTADLLSVRGMRKELSEIFDKLIEATQEKSVTRKMGIDEKQKYFDKFHKSVQREADDLIKKFTNGVRRYQYNRKTKQREDVVIKATPDQIKKAKNIVDKIIAGEGTKPTWDRIPESKSRFGDYSYISPEMLALDALHKEVFGKTGLKRDGAGFYNLGYYGDRMYRAKETLDKALAGESETLNVPTDFLKVSREFDKSRANPYWSTKIEMFARAFEYFIESKLLDQNVRADYLQYDKAPVYDAVYGKNPYPQGEERAELNRLFEKFFKEVRVKTDENNVSLLYEKAEEYISENKVYQQARPLQDFPEGVSYLSERSGGSLSGQLNLFGESDYTPTADDGNITYVERLISERGVTFLGDKLTGPPTIRTSADIAYLFKNLESATSENAFAVLISKTGEYKVLYLGTGGTTGVIIDSKLILAAAKDFGAKRVVVVHNHPSGNLQPSGADMAFDTNINSALASMGIDLDPSIIIDLDSGEFTVFAGENVDYKKYRKEDYGTDVLVEDKTIYQFEKKKLYVPASERTAVKNSADIAEYLSKMKRGTTPKLHVMILDRSLHINKYLLYDETISNEELIAGLLYEVGKHGEMVALASNTRMSPGLLVDLAAKLKKVDSDIIDFIQIKQGDDILNNYMSYADQGYLSESKVPYESTESSRERQPEFAGEYLERAQDITKTPAFKKWFGNSKVVDENGKPLVVYHGTRSNFDVFKPSGKQGNQKEPDQVEGMYFTDNQAGASFFSSNSDDPQYLKAVYLSIQNPYITEGVKSLKESLEIDKLGDVAEKLKSMGYDGLIMEKGFYAYGGPHKQIIAFSPTQIKSTGNKGTFDPENPSILEDPQQQYQFAGQYLNDPTILQRGAERYRDRKAARSFKESLQGIREYIQDMSLPIRKFEEEVLKRGGIQDNRSKPYRDMFLGFGRMEKLYTDFMERKMKPVIDAVAAITKTGVSGIEILPYIISKHAIERNAVMRGEELRAWVEGHKDATFQEIEDKRSSIKNKDYSGVMEFDTKDGKPQNNYTNPDDLARDIVAEFEGKVDKSLIDDLWAKIKTASRSTLDTWETSTQISQKQKQEYIDKYRFFVPLRGWRDGAAKELVYTRGQGFGRSLVHAQGRKSLADNPLAYMQQVQFQAIGEQVDNEVKTSMLNLIMANLGNNEIHELATIKKLYYIKVPLPDGTYEWEPTTVRPPQEMFDNKMAETRIYREHEKLRTPSQAMEHEVWTNVSKPGGDLVIVFKGKHLTVGQALNRQNYMIRAIWGKVLDARDMDKSFLFAWMGHMNNTLKALYTSWNVVFPFTNFMRDFQEASITQSIKMKKGGKVITGYKGAFPAIMRRLRGKPDMNNPMDRQLEEFYNLGGATGYTHNRTIEEIEKEYDRELRRMVREGTVRGEVANAFRTLFSGVNAWNKLFEDATRFSVYLSSLAAGNTKEDAAYDAKEASVNFNRKGKGSKAWDAWFAFFNVAIQSLQKNFQLAKDYPKRFSQVALSFIMLGFLEAVMNALTDDDDDPDSSYYNLNPYMRHNYLVIPNLPRLIAKGEKGDKYLSIPLPQFWRGFKSMGALAFDVATKKIKPGEAVVTGLGNFAGSLLPVDLGGFYRDGEFSFAPLAPTVIKPGVELLYNRNYMGYTIRKEPFTREQKELLANSALGKDNVNVAAKFFTDMLYRWSGGEGTYRYHTDRKGRTRRVIMDVNPSTLEHLFKGYTGGTGAVFSDLITTISQALDPQEDIDFRNAPFVNKFLRQTPEAKWNIISEYYDLRKENNLDLALMKEYKKKARETGDTFLYERMATDEYRVLRQQIFDSYDEQIKDLTRSEVKDDMETASLAIEMMDLCIGQVKELDKRYRK